mmetsp:Transcript_134026/g.218205  ORF Transcript_134026/g.218205 Transcript_134026/m.218205 type:complete len:235 (-) Transcript_134026:949-1653(-)
MTTLLHPHHRRVHIVVRRIRFHVLLGQLEALGDQVSDRFCVKRCQSKRIISLVRYLVTTREDKTCFDANMDAATDVGAKPVTHHHNLLTFTVMTLRLEKLDPLFHHVLHPKIPTLAQAFELLQESLGGHTRLEHAREHARPWQRKCVVRIIFVIDMRIERVICCIHEFGTSIQQEGNPFNEVVVPTIVGNIHIAVHEKRHHHLRGCLRLQLRIYFGFHCPILCFAVGEAGLYDP